MLMASAAATNQQQQQPPPNGLYNTWLNSWITSMNGFDLNSVTNESALNESKQPILNDSNSFDLKTPCNI